MEGPRLYFLIPMYPDRLTYVAFCNHAHVLISSKWIFVSAELSKMAYLSFLGHFRERRGVARDVQC